MTRRLLAETVSRRDAGAEPPGRVHGVSLQGASGGGACLLQTMVSGRYTSTETHNPCLSTFWSSSEFMLFFIALFTAIYNYHSYRFIQEKPVSLCNIRVKLM